MFRLDLPTIKEIDHTADAGIEVSGDNLPALFANLAFGMLSLIVSDFELQDNQQRSISLSAASLNQLIIDWLSEINYLLQVNHFLVTGIEVKSLTHTSNIYFIAAKLYGCDSKVCENDFKTEIKAVTYHQLECIQKDNKYIARVIFDI